MAGVFVGRHDRQLDPKGRLALPASFRQKFESEAYLTFGENGCVDAFTPEEYEQMAQETMDKVRQGEIGRNRLRALSANTFAVPIDAQGRIVVDQKLRDLRRPGAEHQGRGDRCRTTGSRSGTPSASTPSRRGEARACSTTLT